MYKVINKEKRSGERQGQCIFAIVCFGATKKALFSVVMLKNEEQGSQVLLATLMELLQLSGERGG